MSEPSLIGPLGGVVVLDVSSFIAAPAAAVVLADFGADVIKIEQPGVGDYARHLFMAHGENPVFTSTNRGKRSIAIDLKRDQGREVLIALARTADVFIEGFRPGVMGRLGLGYEVLHSANPRLIYVALTGYGQSGPMRDSAGHDINYLAMSGALDMIGLRDGEPIVPGVQIADIAGGGMQAAMGVLLALVARERTGEGQFVDVSMTRGAANLTALPLAQYSATGDAPVRGEGILSGQYACYSVYRARDNRWLAVGALEPKFWESLCRALERPDLIDRHYAPEPRQSALKHELGAIFAGKDAADWLRELEPSDCCVTLVRTVAESAGCEWLRTSEPAPGLTATAGRARTQAPRLGEHTRQVLLEAGLSESKIDHCIKTGGIA